MEEVAWIGGKRKGRHVMTVLGRDMHGSDVSKQLLTAVNGSVAGESSLLAAGHFGVVLEGHVDGLAVIGRENLAVVLCMFFASIIE